MNATARLTRRPATWLAALIALSMGVAACSDDGPSEPEEPAVDLSGSYSLVSFTFEGQGTFEPPQAVGTLTLTRTRYSVSLTIQTPTGVLNPEDEGTYSIDGNQWSQVSDNGDIQSVGTFDLTDGILTVDVETQGLQIINVWEKS